MCETTATVGQRTDSSYSYGTVGSLAELDACRENPCRTVKAQNLLGNKANVEPGRKALLPALHPQRNLHGGSERGADERRGEEREESSLLFKKHHYY